LGSGFSVYPILIIIPLAVITGFAGSGSGQAILYLMKRRNGLSKKIHKFLYVVICSLIIAAAAVFISGQVLCSGKEIMVTTLFTNQKHLDWYVPLLRIFGSIISFSTGAAGGIFAPSLSAGASIGAVVAGWFHLQMASTNLIILCGMAGFLTSITRSPFTSAILVLEMTNSHNVIFYILLTALISNLMATFVNRHPFYDQLKDKFLGEILQSEIEDEKQLSLPKTEVIV
jgi:H+/Cl- antiporter ClcA